MFPTPIEKRSKIAQMSYKTLVPVVLIIWLLPLIAVALFSMRPLVDFTNGIVGWPSSLISSSIMGVFSLKVICQIYVKFGADYGAHCDWGRGLSTMTGFALGIYNFAATSDLFHFYHG